MALNLGELSIALEVENNLGRGLNEAKREIETLPPVARREVQKVSRIFDEEGRRSGGKLAQGINAGLIRNSPLIAAAVAAALAAGAPLALAAAGILFGGIAGLAASQSLEVRAAWMETWQDIRSGAVADAQVLVPAFTRMADQIGAAFERMRPQIQGAFADSAPLVDSFTDGIIDLGENALPGLVRAVAQAGPVFEGLESFLADTGTGLTNFFDAMSAHSPAAGAAFASLGDIMATLLPLLGEILGQGAELAATTLPLLSGSLGLVLTVVQALGPLLPVIAAGFGAMKIASAVSPLLGTLAQNLALASYNGGMLAGTAGKMSTAVSNLSGAVTPLALGIGAWAAVLQYSHSQISRWTNALNEGGAAARQAKADMSGFDETMGKVGTVLDTSAAKMNIFTASTAWAWELLSDDTDEAREANEKYLASLSPVEDAQRNVSLSTQYLNEMLKEHGAGSDQAEGAARALGSAEKELARLSGEAEMAIQGVTSAMVAQAEQALAMANADYAYRSSLEGIDDQLQAIVDAQLRQAEAQTALNEARATGAKPEDIAAAERDLAAATESVSDAQFQLEGSLLAAAEAAGRLAADALPATATELQRQQAAAAGSLGELERLKTEMGTNFPPALQQAIDRLKQSGVALTNTSISASDTAARIRDLGFQVKEVPGQKFVRIDAPTAPQIEQLKALGWQVVNLPNGDVYVAATTADAEAAINYLARPRTVVIRAQTSFDGRGMPARAAGGPVWPGQTFLVGEQGPELVRFAGAGTVIPAGETQRLMSQAAPAVAAPSPAPSSMGGGSGVVINDNRTVNAYGLDEAGLSRRMQQDQQTRLFLAGVRR